MAGQILITCNDAGINDFASKVFQYALYSDQSVIIKYKSSNSVLIQPSKPSIATCRHSKAKK